MSDFGGLGGFPTYLPFERQYADDLFAQALHRALGSRIRVDTGIASKVWAALANVDWHHKNGDTAAYSFRAAGDLIASIRQNGDYIDWYCCRQFGVVDPEVSERMLKEGWMPRGTF